MLNIISHLGNKTKTTMKYQSIPIRAAKIKNHDNTKCWQGHREIGFIHFC